MQQDSFVFASFSVLSSFTLTCHDVTVIEMFGRVIINTFIMKGKAELKAKSGRSHAMKYEESLPYMKALHCKLVCGTVNY
ncbi:hypothetical protein OUZ56_010250 [Daphnia magna]|uniref:Uncharacterized protein n=1 Tax=Daphnia magna TaxID=35525 RepID=A0ABR0AI20_9CRUS|nr:hypothetical protein OUZ56_010250 [Daphnia magna]